MEPGGSEDQTVSYRRSLSIHGFCYVLKAGVLDAIPTDAKRWLYPCGYFPRSTAPNLPQCPEVTDLFQPQSTPGTVTGKPWGHFGLLSNGLCQSQSVLPLCVLNPLHFLCWCCLHPVLILANAFLNYRKHPSLHITLQRTGRLLSHILGTYKCPWSTSVFHWAHKKNQHPWTCLDALLFFCPNHTLHACPTSTNAQSSVYLSML